MDNNFKNALKINTLNTNNTSSNKSNKTNLLLSKLSLLNIPENVLIELSDDYKYLNIQLKPSSQEEQHLLFQFPIEETDLSALKNRHDYQDLLNRYNLYTNDYVDEIKKYSILERAYLQKRFPGLVFNIKIRIKSYDSYINKLNENILKGKDPYINDIMAERIIISEYNGSTDESILKDMCDQVSKALYDFRIQTNFRMKKDLEPNKANSDKEYVTKDYIAHPKDNGYQSEHILMEHKKNKDFKYETQVRTLEMESISKTSGEIAHKKYKPRSRLLNDLSPNRVPIYYEISPFIDAFGNPTLIEIPFENRFYHFYNSEKTDHSYLKGNSNPITYKRFREEQYELEQLLDIDFKEIRQKLRLLNEIEKKHTENKEVR